MKTYNKALFLFHRDLRLHDNTGLIAACTQSTSVIPCFIFTPEQVDDQNTYKSDHAIQFMIESLRDLSEQLKHQDGRLYIFYDTTEKALAHIIRQEKIDALFSNKDYTPFAHKRDAAIAKLCKEQDVDFHTFDDALLNPPGSILTGTKQPYKVFTPFWHASVARSVEKETHCTYKNFYTQAIKGAESTALYHRLLPKENNNLAARGGRKEGLRIAHHLKGFTTYQETRDTPSIDTTLLSAHLKFGTLSIREIYRYMHDALGSKAKTGLIRQLYWRDFWYHVAYFWPRVFGHAFQEQYDDLVWNKSTKDFNAWCTGMTGFPIVDAGMRQLNATGFMHNRVRMIVASFLTKDLHIDWRKGERYFAQKLIDYDPCVNNGNWQWAASTGCDPQPYFRIFNPWLQQKKFDPACTYIKQWIVELQDAPNKVIHEWYKKQDATYTYPAPMIDHDVERAQALILYGQARKKI